MTPRSAGTEVMDSARGWGVVEGRAPRSVGLAHVPVNAAPPMIKRIGIVGGGALGTLLARRLLKAGARVQILTRSAARRRALRREFPAPELPEDAAPFRGADAVFVCVKSYDTQAAA